MPVIAVATSVPANGTVDNALVGSQFEFLPYDAQLEFAIVAAAAGIRRDVYSGQDALVEDGLTNSANRFPLYPDDYDLTDVAAAGERLKVRLRNTTGGAITVNTVVRITPL